MLTSVRPSSKSLFILLRTHHLQSSCTAGLPLSTTANTSDDDQAIASKEEKISSFRDELDNGPQLGDFIAGVVPRNVKTFTDYSGKIKREPGETGR